MAKKIMWIVFIVLAMGAIGFGLLYDNELIEFEEKPKTEFKTPVSQPDYRIVTIKGVEYTIDANSFYTLESTNVARIFSYFALDEDFKPIKNITVIYIEKNFDGSHWEVRITPEEEPTTLSKFDPTNLPKAE